jgi:hypothetical protein
MNCSTLDILFLSEALSEERIWVILKVANLMRKVWWLQQEEKEKKLIWRFAKLGNWTQASMAPWIFRPSYDLGVAVVYTTVVRCNIYLFSFMLSLA